MSFELTKYLGSMGAPLATINTKLAGYISYIQNQYGPKPRPKDTTESGYAASTSPMLDLGVRKFIERYDRRQVIKDVQEMFARDPIMIEAAQMFVQTAVSKSFTVQVNKTAARGVAGGTQNRAQATLNRVVKDCALKDKIESVGFSLLSDGDLFMQNVVHNIDRGRPEVIDAFEMPAASIERLTDLRDHFSDPLQSFRQIDLNTQQTIDNFAQWQISHARWNRKGNQRYGNSQYLQLRTMGQLFYNMLIDMAIRRKTRGPLRIGHIVSAGKDAAGNNKGAKWGDVNKYREENNLTDKLRQGKVQITADYFSNGLVDWKPINGDARLGDIKDVEFLFNCMFPRLGIAKGLIGYGETVSRDILDEQREILYTKQDLLIDMLINTILNPLFDLALLVDGINPDAIVYSIHFEDRASERAKREKAYFYLDCITDGIMTRKQAVMRLAPYLDIKDVEAWMTELEEERKLLKPQPLQPSEQEQDNPESGADNKVRPIRRRAHAS